MTRKKHIALAALFIAVNLIGALVNSSASRDVRALDAAHYEDASDAELARASMDPIVCVAASTTSGCG